jgi:pilus assembly protein CpaE
MLKSLLIAPDDRMSTEMTDLLARLPEVEMLSALTAYPSTDDLLRIVRVRKLDCLFLEVDDFSHAKDLLAFLDSSMPGFPVITLGSQKNLDLLPSLMRLGVRELLTSPVEFPALVEAVRSTQQHLKTHPVTAPRLSDLSTFLPAKPGVGTSTIAISVSCAIAEELGVRTLLMDCDLAAGAIQFLLRLGKSASITDALGHSENLDEGLWAQMVGKWGKLDVLHAGDLEPLAHPDTRDLQRVLGLARAQYDVICADLASNLDGFTVAMLRESHKIFLVTTPEVVALHMAAARLRRLTELDLGDRVSLLLNRKTPSRFDDVEVARAVGIPITHCFANDYAGVQGAILDASPISHKSDLGQSVLDLAHSLAPQAKARPTAHPRKFLEFFHVSHAQDPDIVWHG